MFTVEFNLCLILLGISYNKSLSLKLVKLKKITFNYFEMLRNNWCVLLYVMQLKLQLSFAFLCKVNLSHCVRNLFYWWHNFFPRSCYKNERKLYFWTQTGRWLKLGKRKSSLRCASYCLNITVLLHRCFVWHYAVAEITDKHGENSFFFQNSLNEDS